MQSKNILNILLFLIFKCVINVHGDIYEACNETPKHAFIASNTSCSHYIYCAGDESYEGECPDGDHFNESLQTCDPKELVDCKLNKTNNITTNSPLYTQTSTTSATMSTLLSSTMKTTNKVSVTKNISITQSTSLTSANTNTTMPTYIQNETTIIISLSCPPKDNPLEMVFVPNPISCSDYFICYHGDKLPMHCSSMFHFNINTGKCDYPENVRCQTDFTNPKQQCQTHIVDLFPHTTICNYFYSCRNGYLLLQQCPFGYGWDFEKRACTMLQLANCYNKKKSIS